MRGLTLRRLGWSLVVGSLLWATSSRADWQEGDEVIYVPSGQWDGKPARGSYSYAGKVWVLHRLEEAADTAPPPHEVCWTADDGGQVCAGEAREVTEEAGR